MTVPFEFTTIVDKVPIEQLGMDTLKAQAMIITEATLKAHYMDHQGVLTEE